MTVWTVREIYGIFRSFRICFKGLSKKRELLNKWKNFWIGLVGLSAIHQSRMPSELSEVRKKRNRVARTLILNPEIMLYMSLTAGLDPITCMDINSANHRDS